MKVLVINCGSSSLKFRLYDMDTEKILAKGLCERIGMAISHFRYQPDGKEKIDVDIEFPDHDTAVKKVLETLTDKEVGVIDDLSEIEAVGHRIVHGGDKFSHEEILTDSVIDEIMKLSELAPIHNPVNLIGIYACKKYMPNACMVGVFDTAFHHDLPEEAYLYGIPYKYYEDHKIRRYGFHGMSHEYVSRKAAELMNMPYEKTKQVVCHLGNGASISAIKDGHSIDTSMGYTPLDGIIMGTRSGSIDPEIINTIAKKEDKSISEVINILNRKSGVFGLSNFLSSDFRDLAEAYLDSNEDAVRTLNTYAYAIIKYIGAYVTVLGGADCISFTAGIGENSALARKLVCDRLSYLGVKLDEEANKAGEVVISAPDSRIKVFAIPTDEELAIARKTASLASK